MPAADFALLRAYSQVEPFGVRREDWHHAKTQSLIANATSGLMYSMGLSRSRKTYTTADFTHKRKKTSEQRASAFARFLSAHAKKAPPKQNEQDT